MKLRIVGVSFVYECFAKLETLGEGCSGEDFTAYEQEKEQEKNILRATCNLKFPIAELFMPLDFASFGAARVHNAYHASVFIGVRDPEKIFTGLSQKLEKSFEDLKSGEFKFYPTSVLGTGHFVNKDGEVAYSVTDRDGHVRDIGLGCNGAIPRDFPSDKVDFGGEIVGLENIANAYVKCCYDNIGFVGNIPDITIHINP